jgi:hypothetical protein
MDKGFTIIAHSKDDRKNWLSFIKTSWLTARSRLNQPLIKPIRFLAHWGNITVQLTVAPEEERDDYQTTFALMLFPA